MSYDVTIGDYDGNMTSNISGVFYDHMEGGIPSLHGLTGRKAAKRLRMFWSSFAATRHLYWKEGMVGEPALCAKYDSENGWGSLIGALTFAGEITAACAAHPKSKVSVWY